MGDTDTLFERLRAGLDCAYLSDLPSLAASPEGRAEVSRCVRALAEDGFSDAAWREAAAYLFPGRVFHDGPSALRFLLDAHAWQN